MKSLGRIFAHCFLPGSSDLAVEKVMSDLGRCRALDREDVRPYHDIIDQLIEEAPQLRALPLSYTHFDLNGMNILADQTGAITGIVDWEMAAPRPFGINCGCIPFLAGEIVNKTWQEKAAFEAMERGFWESLLQDADLTVRQQIESNLNAIQTTTLIGTLLKVFSIEGETIFVAQIPLKALPTLLKYRIPALRGSAKPFAGTEPRRNPTRTARPGN